MSRVAGVCLAVAVVLLAGCAPSPADPNRTPPTTGAPVPTPSYDYAVERVERLIFDAAGFLTPSPELTLVEDLDIPCLDAGDTGSQFNGQVQPGRSYFVGGLPADRSKPELVEAMTAHWTAQGFRVSRDERPQNQVVAVKDPMDFGITIYVNPGGDVSLVASSPCVSPSAPGG